MPRKRIPCYNTENYNGDIRSYNKYKGKYPDVQTVKYYFLEPCFGYDTTCKAKPISFSIHKHDANWLTQIPKDSILNKSVVNFWYNNCLPITRNIYFSYFRNYKKIIACTAVILLIIIILYDSNSKNGVFS